MQDLRFSKRKTGALQLGVWALASLVVLLASGPLAHAATTTINFETLPALALQPSDFFTAGVSQTYTSAGVFSIAGGVALGNPTFLGSFAANGSTPNAYGSTDFADPSLLSTLTLNLPSATQLVTNVTGKLFNGQPGTETYTVTAFSGATQVDIVTLSNLPGSSSATSFGTFSLSSSIALPITKVLITTPNAVANGWDFFVDSIVLTFTPVVLLPDLTISKSHVGSFAQGSTGNNYTVVVSNGGTGDKAAGSLVTVTDVPPSGLTVTAMSGTGWTCTTLPTCTRTDVLLAGNSYPAITVTVSVGAAATSPQVNSITVSTAATESNTGNNNANDSTVISAALLPDLTISKSHIGSFAQGSTGNNYTVVVSNGGTGDKAAGSSVSVTDLPPSDLTIIAMNGSGWTCTILPTCVH